MLLVEKARWKFPWIVEVLAKFIWLKLRLEMLEQSSEVAQRKIIHCLGYLVRELRLPVFRLTPDFEHFERCEFPFYRVFSISSPAFSAQSIARG